MAEPPLSEGRSPICKLINTNIHRKALRLCPMIKMLPTQDQLQLVAKIRVYDCLSGYCTADPVNASLPIDL